MTDKKKRPAKDNQPVMFIRCVRCYTPRPQDWLDKNYVCRVCRGEVK
jgi:ribosomal protein S14